MTQQTLKIQTTKFTCVVEDKKRKEKFSAKVTVKKKLPVWTSLQVGKIDLADIFIEAISGPTKGSHNHFVLHDFEGNGLYIVRDEHGKDIEKRRCSVWDLGGAFGGKIRAILRRFS